jgi:hypothetical protein
LAEAHHYVQFFGGEPREILRRTIRVRALDQAL